MITKVSHIGIKCVGKGGIKRSRDIGNFRVAKNTEEPDGYVPDDPSFEVMCPWCHNMVTVYFSCLEDPAENPEMDGLRYKDVTNQFTGK